MTQRRGLMKGSGRKGYYNVIGKDPMVHKMSARGIKQPQRLGTMVEGHGKAHRPLIITRKPLAIQQGKKVVFGGKDAEYQLTSNTSGAKPKGIGYWTGTKIREGLEYRKESKSSKKAKILGSDVKYKGLSDKYFAQRERVNTLKSQIAERQNTGGDISSLLKELETEEKQYRELQEKVSDVTTESLSDKELEVLAVNARESSLFGFGGNEYESELLRRIAKRKELAVKIHKAEAAPVENKGGLFDDLFSVSDAKPKRTIIKPARRVKSEEERQEEAEAKSLFDTFGEE